MLIKHDFVINRQCEPELVNAVRELGQSHLMATTAEYISELKRPITTDRNTVYLFARNYDVDVCNSKKLLELPGIKNAISS